MIRIGIVGCGRILAAHLQGYQLLRQAGVDDFRITALCARNRGDAQSYLRRGAGPPQRQPVGNSPGDPLSVGDIYLSDFQDDVDVEVFTDYRAMIAEGPVDAVNDFTTHALHHQVGEVALNHDKDLLTQKPLAVSVAAGQRLCQLAEARQCVLGVFENARNRADTRQLGWLFESNHCGTLQLVLLTNVGNWWAPDQIVAHTPWRHQRVEGGGITLDIGVHLFNHLRYVAGEIDTVEAQVAVLEPLRASRNKSGQVVKQVPCDADDTLLASFTTVRGVAGNLVASWAGHGPATVSGPGRGLVYYASAGSVHGDQVIRDGAAAVPLPQLYEAEAPREMQARHFPFGLSNAFALNQLDWLQAVRTRSQPETSGRDGLRDLAASFAILEAHTAGRRVAVQEVLDGELREYQRAIDECYGFA